MLCSISDWEVSSHICFDFLSNLSTAARTIAQFAQRAGERSLTVSVQQLTFLQRSVQIPESDFKIDTRESPSIVWSVKI